MSAAKSTQQLAVVKVGYSEFALPVPKALALVQLLQSSAKRAETNYSGRLDDGALLFPVILFPIGEIQMTTLDPRQIRESVSAAPRTRKRSESVQIPVGPGN